MSYFSSSGRAAGRYCVTLMMIAAASGIAEATSPQGATSGRSTANAADETVADADFALLLERCGSSRPAERYEASRRAWDSLDRSHADLLRRTLADHERVRVRTGAASMLGKLRDRASIPLLIETLQNDDAHHVRREAARALGIVGGRDPREALAKALHSDADPSVRKYAAVALGRIGDPLSVRALEESIERQDDQEVQIVIRHALAGRNAPEHRVAPLRLGEVTQGWHRGTRYLLYVPESYRRADPPPLLVSIHGTHGDPEHYMEMCLPDAERYGLIVIAPHFDYGSFPDFGNLNPWPAWERADLRLLEIIDAISPRVTMQAERFYLFGHSQGGQFVHRFVLAHPDRIRRAAACAGGNYVHPDDALPFPYGTARNPLADDPGKLEFGRLVTTPLAIVIGERDLERRLEEARLFTDEVKAYAEANSLQSEVELHIVPDGPHRGTSNFPAAREFLFRDLPPREE